jgi:hypothetical protein
MISTRDLSSLPTVDDLRRLLQSLAMLDAIICPEWETRFFSFNSKWAEGEQMGSMRNGSGDDFFALFNSAGCFLIGFAHEADMSPHASDPPTVWPGVLSGVPAEFTSGVNEPAFSAEDTTFCIWRRYGDPAWQHGEIQFPEGTDPDGSAELLSLLDGQPATYQEWSEGYYEQPVSLEAVKHLYEHRPLTEQIVTILNAEVTLEDLDEDLREIAYPI